VRAKDQRLGYRDLLDAANGEVTALPPEAAQALLGLESHVFVDIRDPREIEREGGLDGVRLAPRGMLEFWIDPDSPYHKAWFAEDRTFVFFCAGGWRSALAAKLAQDMGLEKVAHVEGGFSAWKKAGLPHVPGKPHR